MHLSRSWDGCSCHDSRFYGSGVFLITTCCAILRAIKVTVGVPDSSTLEIISVIRFERGRVVVSDIRTY